MVHVKKENKTRHEKPGNEMRAQEMMMAGQDKEGRGGKKKASR